jgi:hypothetical protein
MIRPVSFGLVMSALLLPVIMAGVDGESQPPEESCRQAFQARRLGGHEMRYRAEVLKVREVRGTVASEAGPWPEGSRVIVQLFGPANRPSVSAVIAASDGRFRLPRVASGAYCYEASAHGWDPVWGRLEVSPTYPADSRINLVLPLGH